MVKTRGYKLVRYVDDADSFEAEIQQNLDNGWELYGNPFSTTWIREEEGRDIVYTEYCQAMVLYELKG